jgi:hypothetical protein
MSENTETPQPTTEGEKLANEIDIVTQFHDLIKIEDFQFDTPIPALVELSNKLMPLKINSITDKPNYELVKKALRYVVGKRTSVEEKRLELKRAVDARAKYITAQLAPIETHLFDEKQRIDLEVKRIEDEKEQKRKELIDTRTKKLISIGMYQTSTEFVWRSKLAQPEGYEDDTFLRAHLETSTDGVFNEFVDKLIAKIDVENAEIAKIEEDRKAEAEKNRLENERLEKEKLAFENEKKEFAKQRAIARNEQILAIGNIIRVDNNPYYVYQWKSDGGLTHLALADDLLNTFNAGDWSKKLEEIKLHVAKLVKEDDKELAVIEEKRVNELTLQNRTSERNSQLAGLGLGTMSFNPYWVYISNPYGYKCSNIIHSDEVYNLSPDEWTKRFEAIKDQVDHLKKSDEKEQALLEEKKKIQQPNIETPNNNSSATADVEIPRGITITSVSESAVTDKQLFTEYLSALLAVKLPELKTKKWQGYVNTVVKTITNFKNTI